MTYREESVKAPYGALLSLDRFKEILDEVKTSREERTLYHVYGGSPGVVMYIITPDCYIAPVELSLLGPRQALFVYRMATMFDNGRRYDHPEGSLGNSLGDMNVGSEGGYNRNYLFEERDLAEDFLRLCKSHPGLLREAKEHHDWCDRVFRDMDRDLGFDSDSDY